MRSQGPVVLAILDGWGIAPPGPGNAIKQANTPYFDKLWETFPRTMLSTSGRDVGLRDGQMGNSEVGHLNIGAGFIVHQTITLIDLAIEDGSFFENQALLSAIEASKRSGSRLHIMGLVSDGGVHSDMQHLEALIEMCARNAVEEVAIHAFLDGRDTSPTNGVIYLDDLARTLHDRGVGRIASVIGRYYAMDRDTRWDRTRKAFDLLVHGIGERSVDPVAAVQRQYDEDITDEFMSPIVIAADDEPATTIRDGDSVIFFNFRADRPRQLTQAFIGPDIPDQDFSDRPTNLTFVTMLPYANFLDSPSAFEPVEVVNPLARVVSEAGLRQFHTAETEKYPHVTYFINGGRELPFEGEDRTVVPSPRIATYDLQPEMSAAGVAQEASQAILSGDYELIILNFANCDMVGHTGDIDATVAATEAVDAGLAVVAEAAIAAGGCVLVIADHGNAEKMIDEETGSPMTAHTTNPVPCILVSGAESPLRTVRLHDGCRLADVAPTLLSLLGLNPSPDMTGESIIS